MRTRFSSDMTMKCRSLFIIFMGYNNMMFSRIDFTPIQFRYLREKKRSLKNSGTKSNGRTKDFSTGSDNIKFLSQ